MASSSIGIQELVYASLPFSLDGSTAFTNRLQASNKFPHELFLISGVRSEDDVMRGEETQLVGLADTLHMQNEICIFPGTHSKHMYISGHQMTGFNTYITGELFQTIASHTILRNSVEKTAGESFEIHAEVFNKGVMTAANQSNLLHTLFTIRTGELFKKLNKEQNYYYLSGMLIGQELAALQNNSKSHITLCCASNLLPYYQTAIARLGFTDQTHIVSGDIIDTIAVAGQLKIYKMLLHA
jgi:2-dehydro-3-deoxygalactonokinase